MLASAKARLGALVVSSYLMLFSILVQAETITWLGKVDSLWNTAGNWSANRIPGTADDVVLDNSVVQDSYNVYLPIGNNAVTVRSLQINATGTFQIELILPSGNTAAPAFSTVAYPGISLGRGAVFCNASGATSGSAVATTDSLRLLDGGTFLQRSETAHAALITRLSIVPWGREGKVEFDVPGPASYTVSVSNRTYGHLTLSASAAGGTKNYLSSGSNPVTIRGALYIGKGVNYNLNSTSAFRVYSNMTVDGNFNMSTGSSSNTIYVSGVLICRGTITESGSGQPVVECNGSKQQQVEVSGSWQNAVGLAINNPYGVALSKPLTLSSKLILKEGKLLTGADHLITLSPSATVESDTLNMDTYIDGPVRKLGLALQPVSYFPVGKENKLRWLKLRNASGDCIVEFFKGEPLSMSKVLDTALDHLSGIEYWAIRSASDAQASFVLSFDNVNSGGVTNLGDLRVAFLKEGKWQNAGNMGTTGTAGSSGTVTSEVQDLTSIPETYLTLASSTNRENPLPAYQVQLRLTPERAGLLITGVVSGFEGMVNLRMESSTDKKYFQVLSQRTVSGQHSELTLRDTFRQTGVNFYRLAVTTAEGKEYYSRIIPYFTSGLPIDLLRVYPVPADQQFVIELNRSATVRSTITIYDARGRAYATQKVSPERGDHLFQVSCASWPPGIYSIQVATANGKLWMRKIIVSH